MPVPFFLHLHMLTSLVLNRLELRRLSLVDEEKLLSRTLNRHAELRCHVHLQHDHCTGDAPHYIICDALHNLELAGNLVLSTIVIILAHHLHARRCKQAQDVDNVNRRVDIHESLIDQEARRVVPLNESAQATDREDEHDRWNSVHHQQAVYIDFLLHIKRDSSHEPVLVDDDEAGEHAVVARVDSEHDPFRPVQPLL